MGEERKRWGRRSWRQSEFTETQSWHTLSCRLFYWVIEWELARYGNSVCVYMCMYVRMCVCASLSTKMSSFSHHWHVFIVNNSWKFSQVGHCQTLHSVFQNSGAPLTLVYVFSRKWRLNATSNIMLNTTHTNPYLHGPIPYLRRFR